MTQNKPVANPNKNGKENSNQTASQFNFLLGVTAVVVAFALAAYLYTQKQFVVFPEKTSPTRPATLTTQPTGPQTENSENIFSYQGEKGKTALQLLQEKAKSVKLQDSMYGKFVSAINGKQAVEGQTFWAFYINDKPATQGAQEYQTSENDKITWRLEEVE